MSLHRDAAPATAQEVTHAFLFADLRGYTQLVDTQGATEAGRLLERYRTLTRDVVGRHGGAEIKTEGDSFYVVLPTASAAVRCGLALVEACGQPPNGGELIPVGVGIHAGESIAHEGGFVGSAVNIAARICAVAGPGELLASATVRDLTRSMGSARFVPLGRRQLKGLAEPLELFRVVPQGAALPSSRQRRGSAALPAKRWLVGGVLTLAVVGLGLAMTAFRGPLGLTSGQPTASVAASAPGSGGSSASSGLTPSASIARLPLIQSEFLEVAVGPGTYAPNANLDVASVTVADTGWTLENDTEDFLRLRHDSGGRYDGAIGIGRISVVYEGPCVEDGTRVIGQRPQDLIEWLRSAPQFEASNPRAVNDLGRSGIAIDVTVRRGLTGCLSRDPSEVAIWQIAGGTARWDPGSTATIEALNDGDRTLTVVMGAPGPQELAAFQDGPARRLLDSVVIR